MGPWLVDMKIPITKPFFGEEEKKTVLDTLEGGWVVQGPRVREFERLFEQFHECKHAIATNSATAALHLALVILGIKPEEEVIVPAFTHPSTANVVLYVGARPVFVDINLSDFNINPPEIEKKVTKKTKAIIPVHLFGQPADMHPIMDIVRNLRLRVIEDAACAHGAEYKGKKVGTIGDCGVFSFHPRKVITTGEGGMLTTNDDAFANWARILRSHGESISDDVRHRSTEIIYPDYVALGFNYRMTDIQAAVGVEQMKKLRYILQEREKVASSYNDLLSDLEAEEFLGLPHPSNGFVHSYQSYVILLKERTKGNGFVHSYQSYVILLKERTKGMRDRISNELQKRGIATRKGTYHIPGTRYYRQRFGFKTGDFPSSEMADQRSLALPLYAGMKKEEIDYVVDNLEHLARKG
jgi:dTDP-4-amino-4,6-dideoxygalactose transaminase